MIDIIIFLIFIIGIIIYYTTYNIIFLILSIVALIIMHGIHQQEIINTKTGLANDIINYFKKDDKNE